MVKRLLYMVSGAAFFVTVVSVYSQLPLTNQLLFMAIGCVAYYAGYEAELMEKRANG